jgi:antibiotic biosynthesis monooxygenase (ABM) superfamily enzyme
MLGRNKHTAEWKYAYMITCSDFYPLSNQINLFMVINIWGIIIYFILLQYNPGW